jgi:hypothetical protein
VSLLSELNTIAESCGVPVETGVFSDAAPDTYLVLTPLSDGFDLHADDRLDIDTQEVRLSLFCRENYMRIKNTLVRALLAADVTVTDRRYIGHEDDTGFHHYAIDVAKHYGMED